MPTTLSKKQAVIIIAGVVLVVVIGALIFMNLRPAATNQSSIKLTVWGTEDANNFKNIFSAFPYATVTYVQKDPATYDADLLSALAAGTGPDVFEMSNRDLPKMQAVLAPLPAAYAANFNMLTLQNDFPDVVAQDFSAGTSSIYGLPLSIDTLAMVYNKDLFNSAGIAVPPKTWDGFDADIAKLRQVNAQGQLTQAAAAIGGSTASIANAPDLLSLLMLQNGTPMTNDAVTAATFASTANAAPGIAAFNFYLQFANAGSPYYTWSDGMGDSTADFVAGKVAVIFAYQADLAAIKAKAPFLNFGVAPMPQATGATVAVNYPKYDGFVAAKAGQVSAAWSFILYLTTTPGNGTIYQEASGKPPALRTDIAADLTDPNLAVFASQALTSKSWHEPDDAKVQAAFDAAIRSAASGATDPATALGIAQSSITALYLSAQ